MHINRYACMNAKTIAACCSCMHVLLGAMMCFMDTRSGRCHEYHCYCSSCVWYVDGCLCCINPGKGATLHKPKFSEALRTGLIFGAVETLTPLIGWEWAC